MVRRVRSLAEPSHVASAVAAAVGVREVPDRGLTESLIEFVDDKSLLLVLDNCEHVVDAAAHLADALLQASAQLHILATSREPLGCIGETTWRVPSLSQPEAVRLFIERARAARPELNLVEIAPLFLATLSLSLHHRRSARALRR